MAGKVLHYKYAYKLMERKDEDGRPVPFSFKYISLKGEIVNGKNVVTTSADAKHKTHTVKFLDSEGQIRKIHDVLLVSIDDTQIMVR